MDIETTVDCDLEIRFITQFEDKTGWHYFLRYGSHGVCELTLEQMEELKLPIQNPD